MNHSVITHPITLTGDAAALSAVIATLEGWLPHVAAILPIIYFVIQIAISVETWRAIQKNKQK